jgi:hypothetical protein
MMKLLRLFLGLTLILSALILGLKGPDFFYIKSSSKKEGSSQSQEASQKFMPSHHQLQKQPQNSSQDLPYHPSQSESQHLSKNPSQHPSQKLSQSELQRGESLELQKSQDLVNHHLKKTHLQIQLQKESRLIELQGDLQRVAQQIKPGHNILKAIDFSDLPRPLEGQDRAHSRLEQGSRKRQEAGDSHDQGRVHPRDMVLSRMGDMQKESFDELLFREQYILEFRRNAWLGGYDIQVNEKGEVLSVKPLPPQSKGQPFPGDL